MERVWIGVGSNLLNPRNQVDCAVEALSQLPQTRFVLGSKYYRSRPLGYYDQPDFLNMVIVLDTRLNPDLLLSYMRNIERRQGRIQQQQKTISYYYWKPRTLDLDILLFGKYNVRTNNLIIPHYDMMNREFVLYPLFELDKKLIFPNNICIVDVIRNLPKNGLTLWKD